VILSSIPITLLLLKNNQISLYQSLNFVLSPLNHPESGTILFGMTAYLFCVITSAGATDILSMVSISIISVKVSSSVILNDSSHFNSTSKLFS